MDFMSFFSGSDNLYKHLFIGGLAIVVLSLFYPLEKENALREKKDICNKEIRTLNHEIKHLDGSTTDILELSKTYQETLSKLPKKKRFNKLRKSVQDNLTKQIDFLKKEREQIEIKKINIEYSYDAIKTLDSHIQSYHRYTSIFFWFGIIFTIAGVIGWFIIMHSKKPETPK